jgi:hypothetical protein
MNHTKELYGTLYACWLSISFGFFILSMIQEGCPPRPYYETIKNFLPLRLGLLILLLIVLFASILPTRIFFHISEELKSSFCTDVLIIVLGSFPFFANNLVAIVLLWSYDRQFGDNAIYVLLYIAILLTLIFWRATIDRYLLRIYSEIKKPFS